MAKHASPMPPPRSRLNENAWLIAVLGVLMLVGSGLLSLVSQMWVIEARVIAVTGGVCILVAVLLRPDAIRGYLSGRSAKYSTNALVLTGALVGILAFVNYIAFQYNQEFDLTTNKQFTLSPQTVQILAGLQEPVQVFGFFHANDPRAEVARDYLDRYAQHTNMLSYAFYDPNIEPGLASNLNQSQYGLVFVSDNRQYETSHVDEQALTSGLIRVSRSEQKQIYFTTGHGEHGIHDINLEGLSVVRAALEEENYLVSEVNLASLSLPDDMDILIVAGAAQSFAEAEADLVHKWMTNNGGKLMLLIDPNEPVPMANLLEEYNLRVEDNLVVESHMHALVVMNPEGYVTAHTIAPLITNYPFHEITRGLNGYDSFYPHARSVTIGPQPDASRLAQPLLTTSPDSWAETSPAEADQPQYHEGVDTPLGALHLAAAAENNVSGARVVVIGNVGFVENQNLSSSDMVNLDFFLNAANWLAEDQELIAIRPKPPDNRTISPNLAQVSLAFVTTLLVIPLAVLGLGTMVWWVRR